MDQIFTAAFLVPLLAAGVRMGAPLIFGSVGDVLSEKTGVMNIALEGEMLIAAAQAIASFIPQEELSVSNLLPSALDRRVSAAVAAAVAEAARRSGVARA